jgi:hypothetical protein
MEVLEIASNLTSIPVYLLFFMDFMTNRHQLDVKHL